MSDSISQVSRQGSTPCRALLVVDRSGLALAPLDQADLRPVTIEAVLELAGGLAPLAPPPSAGPLGDDDRVQSVVPSVLRVEVGRIEAWDETHRDYASVGGAALAVLHHARDGIDVAELRRRCRSVDSAGESLPAVVDQLVELGLVELERRPLPEPCPPVAEELAGAAVGDVPSPVVDELPVPPPPDPEPQPEPEPRMFEGLPDSVREAARVVAYRAAVRGSRSARRATSRQLTSGRHWLAGRIEPRAGDADPAPVGVAEVGEVEPAPSSTGPPEPAEPETVDIAPAAVDESPPDAPESPPDDSGGLVDGLDDPLGTGPTRWTDHRTPVFGVYHSPEHNANLGLGLIIAHARVAFDGALNTVFDLRRGSIDPAPMLDELRRTGRSAVVLFSDYMWSLEHNLRVSAAVKDLNPDTITVHGGPHAPAYPGDAERFLAEHPDVDVLVRGEGEVTVAELLSALGAAADPRRLDDRVAAVEGITYRRFTDGGPQVVRTPDRARAAEMDRFPSPYLTGEFAEVDPARWRSATVETNRGCPYGCTFCDWGQATMSRIRQFSLERVFAELEWVASRGIDEVFLADSNFGIYARDIEIARRIAELKEQYGAPRQVICSFAKNTVKHTSEIVQLWVEAGICAEGSVALQTTDPATLLNVARSNIKVEKYDALAEEFRRHRLPIVTDLLMGLPGATVESFKADLQRCLDQEVTPRMMETVVLPNSPMNDPGYRARFRIETDEADVVVATSSYSREDFDEMKRLRLLFRALEHFGLLRHLFRWLQAEHGIQALELIHDIDRAIAADPWRFPLLTWVGRYFDLVTAPPGGWPPFYAEISDLLAEWHGLAEDPGLDVVLQVQEFLMPRRNRTFPDTLDLSHDYVAWLDDQRNGGTRPLTDFPPGTLIVDDPLGVCDDRLVRNGFSIRREEACDNPFWVLNDWELDSALARPMATAVPFMSS